jgi:hypothetical protein
MVSLQDYKELSFGYISSVIQKNMFLSVVADIW